MKMNDMNAILSLFSLAIIVFVLLYLWKGQKQKEEFRITEKNLKWIVLAGSIVVLFSYFFRLGYIPHGLHVDEVSAYYDGISLARYGVDRFQIENPVYFYNYGGGQNALFTYIFSLFYRFLWFSPFQISNIDLGIAIARLPVVFINLIAYFLLYLLLKKQFSKTAAVIGSLIVALLPFSIMHSRWSLESFLLFPMLIISIFLLYHAIISKRKWVYCLSGIAFGFTLYTYAVTYLILPIFLLFVLIYLISHKRITFLEFISFSVPLFLIGFPLVLMVLMNSGIAEWEQFNLFGFTITKLPWFRASEFSIANILENLKNLHIFRVILFDDLGYNSYSSFSTIFYMNIPFLFLGLGNVAYRLFQKEKCSLLNYLMLSLLGSTLLVGLLMTEVNINKLNAIYVPILYFIVYGYSILFKCSKRMSLIALVLFGINFLLFSNVYYNDYKTHLLFDREYINALKEVEYNHLDRTDKVYVDSEIPQAYIYTLAYFDITPFEFGNGPDNVNVNVYEHNEWRYYFPEEIDESGIYVVKTGQEMWSKLMESEKFGYKDFGGIYTVFLPKNE